MSDFERCWPWLAGAIESYAHTHEKEHVQDLIAQGKAQFHPLSRGAMVTTIVTHPTGLKECHFWLAGGELAEMTKIEPLMTKWMKEEGCSLASLRGRPGWKRVFTPDRGYREVGAILVKDLT